ncbi:hypothetical protein [Anaerorhabdus sp.]|uniref:hypothetical protein n=1 Tax=Anaerorhabdus sp. TaxID=1872524 RepID=UPI002FCA9DC2
MILNRLRERIFWLIDSLKGGMIFDSYITIKKIDLVNSNDEYVLEYQRKMWNNLRNHACLTTGYYEKYSEKDICEFPIINKNVIRESQDCFFSNKYKKSDLIRMATSGSTGTPFICHQDINKKRRVNAEIIYYSEKIGYRLGDNLSYIRTIVKQNSKPYLKQFIQNQTLIQCNSLSDTGIKDILDQVKKYGTMNGTTLLGYGSTYTVLNEYLNKKKIYDLKMYGVRGIISGSDMLFDETRKNMEDVFGCKMVSRYSNEENGVLGQDEGVNNLFTINEADYIVEIVDDDGKRVPNGQIGRIVVTDLFNYAMPMIRYDTGDAGAIETININGRNKKVISHFSGRITDLIFDSKGNPLSPHTITNCMWSFPDVRQFQLIQLDKKSYKLKINIDNSFDRINELANEITSILGIDSEIDIEKVNEIPVLKSGKRRYIVNEWYCKGK